MTREEKLEAIYKEMANKKLKLWCKCKSHNWENVIFIRQNKTWSYLSIRENEEFTVSLWYTPEIIWHPIMIWDVLDYFKKNTKSIVDRTFIFAKIESYWIDLRFPINEQQDECVDYVYSLIPSKSIE